MDCILFLFKRCVKTVREAVGMYWSQLVDDSRGCTELGREVQLLLPYFNRLNGLFYRNLYSLEERIPVAVLLFLVGGSLLVGLLVGFMNGFYARLYILVPVIFIVLIVLSIHTLFDMNSPISGRIGTSYEDFKYQVDLLQKSTR